MGEAAPGWYDDGTGAVRWWDGAAWHDAAPQSPVPARPPGEWPDALVPPPQQMTAYMTQKGRVVSSAGKGLVVSGFVVGLVSVFLPLLLGLVGGIVGLTLSILGAVERGRVRGSAGAMAIWGIVLSSIAILLIF